MTIQLGSGLGLCGILVHHILKNTKSERSTNIEGDVAKMSVCLTDGDTDALEQLRRNVELNCPESEGNSTDYSLNVRQLLWGRETSIEFLKERDYNRKETKLFDLMFGSDLIYVPGNIRPMFETVEALLHKNGVFLFAYCSRRQGSTTMDLVLEEADQIGLSYECVRNTEEDIFVYRFQWK